jgi:hypothetical protein
MFVEEDSLRGQAVNFAKIQCKSHLSDVSGRSKKLVTSDTSPHVYIKTNLEVTLYYLIWVFMSPEMGVSGILDSISKICLVGENNVMMQMQLTNGRIAAVYPCLQVEYN